MSNIKRVGVMALLAVLACVAVNAAPKPPAARKLETLCEQPNLWSQSPDEFMTVAHKLGFGWTDVQKGGALANGAGLEFAGRKATEARATFEGGKLANVQIMLYARADSGAINQFQFDDMLEAAKKDLAAWAGQAPLPLPDVAGPARSKIQHVAWTNAPTRVELEWSALKPQMFEGKKLEFRADFIRVRLLAAGVTPAVGGAAAAAKPRTAADYKARVKHEENGDVVLGEVPMVQSGPKSNPLSIATERVLRYFGQNFDQYQAGQVSDSFASATGNNVTGFRDALKKIAQKLGLRLVVLQEIEVRDFQRLVQDYNHAAVAAHESKTSLEANANDFGRLYWNMNLAVLRTAKLKHTTEYARFKSDVTKQIEGGVPLIWHVMMGKVPEPGLGVTGNSCLVMPRLIIGYNNKTGELLLSDSFGVGREVSRLKWEDAWTIGLSLYVIKPNTLP